jgi:sulfate transport system permease protein
MPLRIEKLFQEYNLPGSFAVASVLTLVAIFTLAVKSRLESHLPTAASSTESRASTP